MSSNSFDGPLIGEGQYALVLDFPESGEMILRTDLGFLDAFAKAKGWRFVTASIRRH